METFIPRNRGRNSDPSDTGKDRRYLLFGTLIVSLLAAGILAYVSFGATM